MLSDTWIKRRRIISSAERKQKIKIEKSKAAEWRLIKEISRPKILIEQIPDSTKPASYYVDIAKRKYENLNKSKSVRSFTSKDGKFSVNSSRYRITPIKNSLPIMEKSIKANEFLPEWLLSRPDFKEACNAYEIEEQEKIPSILEINQHNRSEEDKTIILNYLLSLKLFKDIPVSVAYEIGNKLLKESYNENQKIISKGDSTDCLVIIYKGKVSVYSDMIKLTEKNERETIGDFLLDTFIPKDFEIIADSDCIVFKLIKDDYETAVMNLKRKEKYQNIDVLKKINFFDNWSNLKLLRISALMNNKYYNKGSVIYERGNPSSALYFIKTGIVEIMAYVPMEHYNKWPTSACEWRVHQINREYLVKITDLTSNHYFGETEVRVNGKRTLKAIAQTDVTCLILSKDHFFELLNENEVDLFVDMGYLKIPPMKQLQEKVLHEISSRISSEQALLNALKVNFSNLEGRESVLDPKRKKLNPWLSSYRNRRTESAEILKKNIVFENSRNISIGKLKKKR